MARKSDENERESQTDTFSRLPAALPGTTTLGYTYTGRGQLASVTNGTQNNPPSFVSYLYDPNGNVSTRTLNNSSSSSYSYDAMNRVTNITHNFASQSRSFDYAYDVMGRREYAQRDGGTGDGFEYDNNGQIIKLHQNATAGGGFLDGVLTTFAFDASGNRSSVTASSTTTTYGVNGLNQYSSVGSITPTYSNGNLKTYDGWVYTYDAMNRLTKATKGSTVGQFWYDGLNRQIARQVGGTTTITVWDGWNGYAEFAPAASMPSERLVYGAGGELVQSPLNAKYYYADALGSTSHVCGANANLLESYTYDLYGTPSFYDANGTNIGASANGISRLYTGQQWHASLGLYDNRARFYKPDIGRFLQPDPIGFAGDPANLYRYCGNNPANWNDPSGLAATDKTDGDPSSQDPPDPSNWHIGSQRYPDNPAEMPPTHDAGGVQELPRILSGAPDNGSNAGPGGLPSGFGIGPGLFGGGGIGSPGATGVRGASSISVGRTSGGTIGGHGSGNGPSPVTLGDIFDYGSLNPQLQAWGRKHQDDLQSEYHFISGIYYGSAIYAGGMLVGGGIGELAGSTFAGGPAAIQELAMATLDGAANFPSVLHANSAKFLIGAELMTWGLTSKAYIPINREVLEVLEQEMVPWEYWRP